ncbi:potassium efflux system KefA protein [Geminocystis sp. NIES-3708]|uniref:mechanosensitive ion channel domain-containing protein n=1 Tax=Geminocystis sp. NIES-3708 TaxID=1615909 RepID=UPI0005FC6275|nr:mechanosensitive ion channel domain-containing protein [Geminocystis sp. NIES-3708]BAQ59724.1 potassium efflux system KefA protein [Geminocystis sp. NIES-3708]
MLNWLKNIFTNPLFYLGGKGVSLAWIVQTILLVIIVTVLAKIFKRILKHKILLSLKISESNREVISTFLSFLIATIGYLIVIYIMGINLTSLAVIIGSLGVGIGFGFQELTRNLISGITLLGEGKLKVGDLIEYQGKLGYIMEISIRCTVLKMFDDSELIIPNTELTNNNVINWNYSNCQGRIEVSIGVAYGSDLLLVTDVLLQSAFMVREVLSIPAPQVIFRGFGDNSLNFSLWVWVEKINFRVKITSSLLYVIDYNFRENNINIPFPQRDVWLHNTNDINDIKITSQANINNEKYIKYLLLNVSLFRNFNDLQLIRLIEVSRQKYLQPEEILIKQGEYGDFFALVLEGEIEAIFTAKITKKSIFFFKEGEYFGELPLLLKTPYPTTMKATKPTRLLLIKEENFYHLIKEYPFLAEQIIQELNVRQDMIQDYQQQLREMGLLLQEENKNPLSLIRQCFQQIFNTPLDITKN